MNDARQRLIALLRSSDQLIDGIDPSAPVESQRQIALAREQLTEVEALIEKLFADHLREPVRPSDVRH
ncbi:MAG: hypothetical protein M3541_05605 [Acidobacteriota bacterium]|nr:hypothetical protein [Acidobacteriota bacterium]MDQ3418246.1 hypothetical protein [Acidobacteriota bacterium]